MAARRIAAVATTRIELRAGLLGERVLLGDDAAVSAIAPPESSPPARSPAQASERAALQNLWGGRRASATSTRVVFVPMSMQAQRMRSQAMLP